MSPQPSTCQEHQEHQQLQQQDWPKASTRAEESDIDVSFRSLRRLIGMHHFGDGDDDTDHPVDPANTTFTSLRKLVSNGPGFCLPANNNNAPSTSTPSRPSGVGGVFCDPNRSVYDDSDDESGGRRFASLFVSSTDKKRNASPLSALSPSPSLAPRSTLSSATTPSGGGGGGVDDGILHHQEYLTISQRKMKLEESGISISGEAVSPIPFASDESMIKSDSEMKERKGEYEDFVQEEAGKNVSRSIFKELEKAEREEEIKMETVVSDEDESAAGEPPVEEQDKKKKNILRGDALEKDSNDMDRGLSDKQQPQPRIGRKNRRFISVLEILTVMATITVLLSWGALFRLHQKGKLDTFVNHLRRGTLTSDTLKTMLVEVTGTEDMNLTKHYVELGDKLQRTYDVAQTHLQHGVEDMLVHLEHWQHHLLERMYAYQENLEMAWNTSVSSLDFHHTVNLTKYYADLERTMNATIALELFLQISNSTWEKMETSILHLKGKLPKELSSNFTYTLEIALGKENLEHIHKTWTEINAHILGMNWSFYIEEIETTVTSTIGDENIKLLNNKVAEIEIILINLKSNLTKYYNESTKGLETKLSTAIGPENMAILNRTWADIQANFSRYYEESGLKQHLESSNSTFYRLQEQLFGKMDVKNEEDSISDSSLKFEVEVVSSETIPYVNDSTEDEEVKEQMLEVNEVNDALEEEPLETDSISSAEDESVSVDSGGDDTDESMIQEDPAASSETEAKAEALSESLNKPPAENDLVYSRETDDGNGADGTAESALQKYTMMESAGMDSDSPIEDARIVAAEAGEETDEIDTGNGDYLTEEPPLQEDPMASSEAVAVPDRGSDLQVEDDPITFVEKADETAAGVETGVVEEPASQEDPVVSSSDVASEIDVDSSVEDDPIDSVESVEEIIEIGVADKFDEKIETLSPETPMASLDMSATDPVPTEFKMGGQILQEQIEMREEGDAAKETEVGDGDNIEVGRNLLENDREMETSSMPSQKPSKLVEETTTELLEVETSAEMPEMDAATDKEASIGEHAERDSYDATMTEFSSGDTEPSDEDTKEEASKDLKPFGKIKNAFRNILKRKAGDVTTETDDILNKEIKKLKKSVDEILRKVRWTETSMPADLIYIQDEVDKVMETDGKVGTDDLKPKPLRKVKNALGNFFRLIVKEIGNVGNH